MKDREINFRQESVNECAKVHDSQSIRKMLPYILFIPHCVIFVGYCTLGEEGLQYYGKQMDLLVN